MSLLTKFYGMMNSSFWLFFILTAVVRCVRSDSEFTYYGTLGPDHWSEHYNQCAGKHQSPININDVDVIDKEYPEIEYMEFDKKPRMATMTNNGHTVLVNLEYEGQVPYIMDGPLAGKGKYEFQQLHFHWGEDDTEGSEDRINNVTYPMELHIVFRNTKYSDFEEAARKDDGLAVMALFYEIDERIDMDYDNFTSYFQDIHEPSTSTEAHSPDLFGLLPKNLHSYYTYMGSLTTPPCTEDVIWLDYSDPIPISSELLERFRALKTFDGKSLAHNFRPVQPLNNRKVYRAITLLEQPNLGSDIPFVNAWNNAHVPSVNKGWAIMSVLLVLTFSIMFK